MSWGPIFEIGWLNAWLGALPLVAVPWLMILFGRRETSARMGAMSPYQGGAKIAALGGTVLYYVAALYTIWLPLKIGTGLFYAGVVVFLIGIICLIVGRINFSKTPADQPVTTGLYRISRNPLYFFGSLAVVGLGLASGSWIVIALIVVQFVFVHFAVLAEERFCLEKYGQSYQEYKDRTPRYFLFF